MEETNANNVLTEMNTSHACYASTDCPTVETYANNVITEMNTSQACYASTDCPTVETYANGPRELNHSHYRFAYDLVEKVLDIRNMLNRTVQHNLPEPPIYLFTQEHANIVNTLLSNDASYLLKKMYKVSVGVYNSETYVACRDYFVAKWQKTAYTEKSFISACASIAYVASYFIQINYYCGALDDVVKFIAVWVENILRRGTIDHSCW